MPTTGARGGHGGVDAATTFQTLRPPLPSLGACEEIAVRLRNPGVRKKLPAMLAKFPVRFPAPFPAPRHREFYFKPLQQLHETGCESPDPGAVSK
jgi:hypothetical protein